MGDSFWEFWDDWIASVWELIKHILQIPLAILILTFCLFMWPIGKIGDWRLEREIGKIRENLHKGGD